MKHIDEVAQLLLAFGLVMFLFLAGMALLVWASGGQ